MLNRLLYQGRLVADPELRFTNKSTTPVVNFTLASDSVLKNEDGERKTNFQDFTAFNKKAEFIAEYFKKGQKMIVEASLEEYFYLDKNDKKCKKVYGLVGEVHFCDKKDSEAVQKENEDYSFEPPVSSDEVEELADVTVTEEDITDYDDFI